jgi:molecular chaperone DnaK (HSP70)
MIKEPVIGLDFGNYYSYAFFIEDMDPATHSGGTIWPLLDIDVRGSGIPSFFYKTDGEDPVVGVRASRSMDRASKAKKLLKRYMGKSFTMGGETFTYKNAATLVIQDIVRRANKVLSNHIGRTTNKISLARPATITKYELDLLIDAVEAATLADGVTHLEVVGTVLEPAAAALAYLCDPEFGEASAEWEQQTVLVYDLGGGTFDATILTLYPRGIGEGEQKRYYDEETSDGLLIGGQDFTNVMKRILFDTYVRNNKGLLNNTIIDEINRVAEEAKRDLTDYEVYRPSLQAKCDDITRDMFEDASMDLLIRTIDCTENIYKNYIRQHERDQESIAAWRPRKIILTGGASVMPMVKEQLLRVFSKYGYVADDIIIYKTSTAVSIGAARYIDGHDHVKNGCIFQHVTRDIGIKYMTYDGDARIEYIKTLVSRGASIPTESKFIVSEPNPRNPNQLVSRYEAYEAKVIDPDEYEIDRDWEYLGKLLLEYSDCVVREDSKARQNETRIVIDELGRLNVEARERNKLETLRKIQIAWHNGDGED